MCGAAQIRKRTVLRLLMLLVTMAKRLMRSYIRFYHEDRTHLGLAKEMPPGRKAPNSGADGKVISMPRLGGPHHRYDLAA